jgi:hypothetical protein
MPSVSVNPFVIEMSELSVTREMNIAYPRLITATKDKRHAISTVIFLSKSQFFSSYLCSHHQWINPVIYSTIMILQSIY